jgi:hypothetical protein
MGGDGGDAACLFDDKIPVLMDFDSQRAGQRMEFRVEADPPRAIPPGPRIIAQHRLKAFAVGFVESLVEIAVHQLDQFSALLRRF